jgi:hypothetical protein
MCAIQLESQALTKIAVLLGKAVFDVAHPVGRFEMPRDNSWIVGNTEVSQI